MVTPYIPTSASTYMVAEFTQAAFATAGFAAGLALGGPVGSFAGLMAGDYLGKKLGMAMTEEQRKKEGEAYVPSQDTYQYELSYGLSSALTVFGLNILAPATVTPAGQVAYTAFFQGGYRAAHLTGMEGGRYLKKTKKEKKEEDKKKGEKEEEEDETESKNLRDWIRKELSKPTDAKFAVFYC